MKKIVTMLLVFCLSLSVFAYSCSSNKQQEDVLRIANIYLGALEDDYVDFVKEKFGVKFETKTFSWADWETQVDNDINTNSAFDTFQWDLRSWNFAKLKRWVRGDIVKPLPLDLTAYPNLKKVVDNISGIESMKINGKLYALPLVKNPHDMKSVDSCGYLYRRDWAKQYGVYKENDIYTFEEFEAVLKAFKDNDPIGNGNTIVLADVEWAFPSVANFYKKAVHAYALDEKTNSYVWNYTTPEFTHALEKARDYRQKGYYWADQYSAADGSAMAQYQAGKVGVYYENLTLQNYNLIKTSFAKNNPKANIEDSVAFMKVKNPQGKFPVQYADNWYSAALFNAKISDAKMDKLLKLFDYLLSEEGTMLATYGFKDLDYTITDGNIEVLWDKNTEGQFIRRNNGVRSLRYLCSINEDIVNADPNIDDLTKQSNANYFKFFEEQKSNIYNIPYDNEMYWLTGAKKDIYGHFLGTSKIAITQYIFERDTAKAETDWATYYLSNKTKIDEVLAEINNNLNK